MQSDHYREQYKFEWDQRSHLVSAVNIPIVGITALAAAVATLATGFLYDQSRLTNAFIAALVVGTSFLALSLALVLLSLVVTEYKKLPSPILLKQHFAELLAWYLRQGKSESDATEDFRNALDCHLATAADFNGRRNKFRGNCIALASASLCISLVPLAVAGGLYVKSTLASPDKIHLVRILPPASKENCK